MSTRQHEIDDSLAYLGPPPEYLCDRCGELGSIVGRTVEGKDQLHCKGCDIRWAVWPCEDEDY